MKPPPKNGNQVRRLCSTWGLARALALPDIRIGSDTQHQHYLDMSVGELAAQTGLCEWDGGFLRLREGVEFAQVVDAVRVLLA